MMVEERFSLARERIQEISLGGIPGQLSDTVVHTDGKEGKEEVTNQEFWEYFVDMARFIGMVCQTD